MAIADQLLHSASLTLALFQLHLSAGALRGPSAIPSRRFLILPVVLTFCRGLSILEGHHMQPFLRAIYDVALAVISYLMHLVPFRDPRIPGGTLLRANSHRALMSLV